MRLRLLARSSRSWGHTAHNSSALDSANSSQRPLSPVEKGGMAQASGDGAYAAAPWENSCSQGDAAETPLQGRSSAPPLLQEAAAGLQPRQGWDQEQENLSPAGSSSSPPDRGKREVQPPLVAARAVRGSRESAAPLRASVHASAARNADMLSSVLFAEFTREVAARIIQHYWRDHCQRRVRQAAHEVHQLGHQVRPARLHLPASVSSRHSSWLSVFCAPLKGCLSSHAYSQAHRQLAGCLPCSLR